ncbi:MAG TPA: phytoene/squalene synthase family protein [Chthoniobacterales bacterium]
MSELVPAAIAADVESGRKASNLAFALFALPRQRRADAVVFYRLCRILDDIADSPALSSEVRSQTLDAWAEALAGARPLPPEFADLVDRYDLDRSLLLEILAGVRADLTVSRYATFEDARRYCWRVASAVGLVSIRIFGCTSPASPAYAEALGLALQWTNILRDVGEDAANGRIYLPQDELALFGVAEADILAGRATPEFQRLAEFQAERAAQLFAAIALPSEDRRPLLAAEIMRAIYAKLLDRMRRDGLRVLERRYRVSRAEKLLLAAGALLRR